MEKKKGKFVVELLAKAYVKSAVIVEADTAKEAEELARQVAFEPWGMTDISGSPIEGVGDLVWEHEELDTDSEPNPILEVRPARKIK